MAHMMMGDVTAKDYYQKANEFFIDENYDDALQLYKKAIELEPNNDQYHNSLSQLYLKQNNYSEALKCASMAIDHNPNCASAYLKKGIAQFHLEDYQSACLTFKDGLAKKEHDSKFLEWIDKCNKLLPTDISTLQDTKTTTATTIAATATATTAATTAATTTATAATTTPQDLMPNNPQKTKYDWYQTETQVVITILIKNVQADQLKYNITDKTLSCSILQPSRAEYSLELDLAHPIYSDKVQVKILSTKVEIKMMKQEGIRWSKLEHDESLDNVKQSFKNDVKLNFDAAPPVSDKQENVEVVKKYPSLSQHTKNWDQLVSEIKEEEKDEKLEGDAALNQLFQQIYADGSDEVKKAMMKSFSESGGTVLSTNWQEIGAKKVDIKPPDGMEFKKW